MARLPSPGSDQGQWGAILNEFLNVEHNSDGTLKASGSIGSRYVKPSAGIPEADLDASVRTKLNTVGSGGSSPVTSASITDATAIGKDVLTATDAADARSVIGAGTSNLALGSTSSTAAAGNHTHTKADVGLGNVDNTTDANKPISTATQAALNLKASTSTLSAVATSGSYADLSNRPTIPTVTGTNTGDQTLSVSGSNLTISGGNTVVLPTGGSGSAAWGGISGTVSDQTDLQSALNGKANMTHTHAIADVTNLQTTLDGKQAAGSYATTTALTNGLATKLDASQKAAASGVASLDSNTRVPTAQLGSGTASNSTYLRGDGSWATVSGGSGSGMAQGEETITPTGTPYFTRYNNGSEATFHLTSSGAFSAPYIMGIGNDVGNKYGFLVSNKAAGVGAVFNNTSTVTAADGYALRVTNASTVSPGALFETVGANSGHAARFSTDTAASITSRRLTSWVGQPGGTYTVYGEVWGDGTFNWQGTARFRGNIGFFNTAPIAQPTVTGSVGGNAALDSLLTQLANLGLIVKSTSA